MKSIYIAGPMTGYPEHNFPAFQAEAAFWRAVGWNVVSPAELDGDVPHDELAKLPWQDYLRRDLKFLVDCDAIALLSGWELSRGASLEFDVAQRLGFEIYYPVGE